MSSSLTPTPAPRRYDEKEVGRLLDRAAELQRADPPGETGAGLTLPELEEIAREVGLDVAHLRRAALELDAGGGATPGGLGERLAGAPTRVVLERSLPFEAPDAAVEALVPVVQKAADTTGQASRIGRTLIWQATGDTNLRPLEVMVAVGRGQTLVRVEERHGAVAGVIFGGWTGAIGGGVGVAVGGAIGGLAGSAALAIGLPAAAIAGSYAGSRWLYRHLLRRRSPVLQRLLERVVAALEAEAPR